jgi:fused signal recognition particle receptor
MTQLQQQLGQLQAQLAASEAEQQRLQRQNDALIISHQTISSRCAQLEHELKVISSPSAVQPATNVTQLQMMQQPLAPQQGNCQLNTQQAHKSTSSADSGTHDSTHKQLVHAKQASVASLLLEEQQSIHIQQLTADTKELQVALAAAEQRAAAAEAHEFTTQQQLAALQAQHQRLQQDASHLKQLCRRTLEDAAGSAERHHSEQQRLQQQLADMAAAVGAADAARRAAQRDEAAVLQAVAHITMQRDTASMEVQTLKQQLAATLPEADEAKLLLAAASKELAAAPELLRQQAAHAEQRAVAAEQRAAVADAFKVKAEVECNSVVARCSGGWMKLTPSMRGILAMLMQEARDARDVRGSCEPGCLACGLRISSTGSCKHCTAYTVF